MLDLRKKLREKELLLLDGATGTNLQKAGMPTGVCPELWILEHPEVLVSLQRSYVEAGSQILYAPTFSGNAIKLAEYGVSGRLKEINQKLVALTREAAGPECFVAGNLTMTGASLAPVGEMDFEDLIDCYKEQVEAITEAGADLFVVETMMNIQECRAAVLAVKETTDLPVFVTVTLEEGGRTLYGTDPVTALVTMEALGVDAFGVNCSCGPDMLLSAIEELQAYARIPLIVKPNAGLPRLDGEETVFDMPKEVFAEHMEKLVKAGASIVGGCCGTDPSYIAELRAVLDPCAFPKATSDSAESQEIVPDIAIPPRPVSKTGQRILTSERGRLEFSLDGPLYIVGERINPTGKKKLQKELSEGKLDLVTEMAREQAALGASILDINVGMGGIDEQDMMLKAIEQVGQTVELPLCIDSSSPKVVAAALRRYPGRALVNSISCERNKIEQLLPIVKKYGAMFILLPLRDEGMPRDEKERWENIQYVLEKAYALGFAKEDILVDGLVAAVAAEPKAGAATLATIETCYAHGLATICGLSNISFGLPDRSYVNSVFLGMAVNRGLTMAIANPSQELFVRSSLAADLLMGKEGAALRYVEHSNCLAEKAKAVGDSLGAEKAKAVGGSLWGPGNAARSFEGPGNIAGSLEKPGDAADISEGPGEALLSLIRQDVLKGKEKQIESHICQALEAGQEASEILNHVLIPSINEVGELFSKQVYFLPQLIISAKAMEEGVAVLEPILKQQRPEEQGPVVVIATVKGDIHDIGKNLVSMMMKNYGFRVIDLGKDVDKEQILTAAKKYQADVIGLSALMTTTMSYMRQVIEAVHAEGLFAKVIVGGAAVTPEYAKEIGADGYSRDAVEAVELVKRLLA